MRQLLPLFALLAGCPGTPSTPTDPTGTPTDTDPPTVVPGSDQGNLALVRGYENGELVRAELVGVFANDLQDYLNVAHCLTDDLTPCLTEVPESVGSSVQYDLLDRYVESQSLYRYVGLSVPLGPHEAFYEVAGPVSRYYADVTENVDFEGPADVSIGVEWGDHTLTDAITVPPGLVVLDPPSDETLTAFSDNDAFTLTWEPGGADEMVLFVQTDDETDPGRMFRLEDTGSYALDLNALGLIDNTLLDIQLARWQRASHDLDGHALDILVTAEVDFTVQYVPVGLSTPIEVVGSCEEGPPVLDPGAFYGDLSELENTFEESICLQSVEPATGSDALYTVEVQPRHRMELDFRQLQANAAMYLLESCDPIEPVCVEGADRGFGLQTESITRFNPDPVVPETYTLVLDSVNVGTGGLFFLDHRSIPIPEPDLADTCQDATDAPPIEPGEYYAGTPQLLSPALNPGFNGCTSTGMTGNDGTRRVVLEPGQTLTATVNMEDSDPALYLSTDCDDLTTCVQGDDADGTVETLTYTHNGSTPLTAYLTVDSRLDLQPFFLTIDIQ